MWPKTRGNDPLHAVPLATSSAGTEPSQENPRGAAIIGQAVKIIGQIYTKEDLLVDGDIEGTIEALNNKVTIGPNGTAHAFIKAREIVAFGTIEGNVEATERIEIRKNSKIVGDIRTTRIIIEDGAYFKGSIDIVRPSASRQTSRLAVIGTPDAHAADDQAEQDIMYGRFTTVKHEESLYDVLANRPDQEENVAPKRPAIHSGSH